MPDTSPVTPINVPLAVTSLVAAINRTYSYANNSLFGALIPTFYKDYYWRSIKVSAGWLDGYVPELHSGNSGIISTRLGTTLITGLTRQVCGEQLVFRTASKDKEYESLKFISKWAKEQNARKAVYAGVGFALAMGTSLLKINRRIDGSLWLEAVRFDNCFYLASFSNEVEEATFFMRGYTDTRPDKSVQQFVLCERRYYDYAEQGAIKETEDGVFEPTKIKGTKKAMVEYKVFRAKGTTQNNLMQSDGSESQSVPWDELPKTIRKMIKKDYGALKVGEPMPLGFTNLGVEPLLNGEIDLSIPTATNFGQSMLIIAQDDLITYEIATSYQLRDMYLGKGTVYTPKDLNISDFGPGAIAPVSSPLSGVGDSKIEYVNGVSPDQQKIVVEQFNLRIQEWQLAKENALKNIAVKWGMSPKILASFLATGAVQQTATQIDSEDDSSIAFINLERSYFKPALNRILETVLNYYGKPNDVEVDFSCPSLVNKDRILDRTIKELENGLIDLDEAMRLMNPDMDEEALQAKIAKAKEAREQLMLQQNYEMNQEGGFGNSYDDLGGANLKGSTMPIQ